MNAKLSLFVSDTVVIVKSFWLKRDKFNEGLNVFFDWLARNNMTVNLKIEGLSSPGIF